MRVKDVTISRILIILVVISLIMMGIGYYYEAKNLLFPLGVWLFLSCVFIRFVIDVFPFFL